MIDKLCRDAGAAIDVDHLLAQSGVRDVKNLIVRDLQVGWLPRFQVITAECNFSGCMGKRKVEGRLTAYNALSIEGKDAFGGGKYTAGSIMVCSVI